MPAAEAIQSSLAAIADQWRSLAVVWHFVLALWMLFAIAGWRPSMRVAAIAITLPLVSVSAVALLAGNPFNAAVFALISIVLATIAATLPHRPIHRFTAANATLGLVFVVFGFIYPHFLVSASLWNYWLETPFGLLPCPTLSVVAGLTIMLGAFDSRPWLLTVAAATLIYGLIGFTVLNVEIDLMLIVAGLILAWQSLAAAAGHGNFPWREKIPRRP